MSLPFLLLGRRPKGAFPCRQIGKEAGLYPMRPPLLTILVALDIRCQTGVGKSYLRYAVLFVKIEDQPGVSPFLFV